MIKENTHELIFKHLIELPKSQCVFCSTLERVTGKTKIFLIFSRKDRVYKRNGLKGTWQELTDSHEVHSVRQQFDTAVRERKIPCYSTVSF